MTDANNTVMKETPLASIKLTPKLKQAIEDQNGKELAALLEPLTLSEALREVLELDQKSRDKVMSILPPERAANLIAEAPNELAAVLVERLEASAAADIIDELNSDAQADVIGELDNTEAEAILAEMDNEDAADVRRLASYDDDTAGGLMLSEAFAFNDNDTVGEVLHGLTRDDDFERYRGQHPYVVNQAGAPVGVVSLRSLLTARRSAALSTIMVPPLTVTVDTSLDDLRDLFDEHPFLGLPVVDEHGVLAGVVSRSAVDEATLSAPNRTASRSRE